MLMRYCIRQPACMVLTALQILGNVELTAFLPESSAQAFNQFEPPPSGTDYVF